MHFPISLCYLNYNVLFGGQRVIITPLYFNAIDPENVVKKWKLSGCHKV